MDLLCRWSVPNRPSRIRKSHQPIRFLLFTTIKQYHSLDYTAGRKPGFFQRFREITRDQREICFTAAYTPAFEILNHAIILSLNLASLASFFCGVEASITVFTTRRLQYCTIFDVVVVNLFFNLISRKI